MRNLIDASDPRKYQRLAASLRAQIQDGTIAAGDPVSVTKLAAEYGCARQTCAHALRELVTEGLLARYPGLGYLVTTPQQ